MPDLLTRFLPRFALPRLARPRFVLAPLCLLAACGDDPVPVDEGRLASGEVLEGTISDDMLPLDRLRSQAPLADEEAASRFTPSSAAQAEQAGDGGAAAPLDEQADDVRHDDTQPDQENSD